MVRQAKAQRMLTHDQIWGALDRLAARAGLSPSGLAKRAGLDPTTFNKSKRVTSDGRERWPSTESIAKALAAAESSIKIFARLIDDDAGDGRTVPLLALALASTSGAFDELGFPSGKGWGEIALPSPGCCCRSRRRAHRPARARCHPAVRSPRRAGGPHRAAGSGRTRHRAPE